MLKIGVLVESVPETGGSFRQATLTLKALSAHLSNKYQFVFLALNKRVQKGLADQGVDSVSLGYRGYHHRIDYFLHSLMKMTVTSLYKGKSSPYILERRLLRHHLGLVVFLDQSFSSLFMRRHNYVMTLWDLCYLDWPEFPEVGWDGVFAFRHRYNAEVLPRATGIIATGTRMSSRLKSVYGVDPERVHVVPFLSAFSEQNSDSVSEFSQQVRMQPKRPFVFYPAQFWSHKNHLYIIDAIKNLKDRGVFVDAVFSGSEKGWRKKLEQYATSLGLGDQILFPGFISDAEMVFYYRHALALTMPTYFGPTNIPPLEAMSFDCPVIYADTPDFRDQLGDAALYCDLENPADLADKISILMDDDGTLKQKLVRKGRDLLSRQTPQELASVLDKIFAPYAERSRRWL